MAFFIICRIHNTVNWKMSKSTKIALTRFGDVLFVAISAAILKLQPNLA